MSRRRTPIAAPLHEPPTPVRVTCRGAWHLVGFHDGGLRAFSHPLEEEQRERIIAFFGGEVTGCFAALRTWRHPAYLPKELRKQRRYLLARAQAGDTPAVARMIAAGLDPTGRDETCRTLLHLLPQLERGVRPGRIRRRQRQEVAALLPRLLAAGLDVNGRDRRGWTPLHVAFFEAASDDLVATLLAAGADPTLRLGGQTLPGLIERARSVRADNTVDCQAR
jgi:hypothetical protein